MIEATGIFIDNNFANIELKLPFKPSVGDVLMFDELNNFDGDGGFYKVKDVFLQMQEINSNEIYYFCERLTIHLVIFK